MIFTLYPNASYNLGVHDPRFFIMTGRPLVFPGISKRYLSAVSKILTFYHNKAITSEYKTKYNGGTLY